MLAGRDQFEGAGLPPRVEQGSLREILRVKIGAGFGVPGRREGYFTTKLGLDLFLKYTYLGFTRLSLSLLLPP